MSNEKQSGGSGCGCLIAIIIAGVILFKGCGEDKSDKREPVQNTNTTESQVENSNNTYNTNNTYSNSSSYEENEYLLKAKEKGIPYVSNFEYMYSLNNVFGLSLNSSDDLMALLYYTMPQYYDFLSNAENMPQSEFADAMEIMTLASGGSKDDAELIKVLYQNMDHDSFLSARDDMLNGIKEQSLDMEEESSDIGGAGSGSLKREEYLSAEELDEIESTMRSRCKEMADIFEAFGINLDNYKPERGYKMICDNGGEEIAIKIYFMNGDWRIFV